jgi:hypothetical protein
MCEVTHHETYNLQPSFKATKNDEQEYCCGAARIDNNSALKQVKKEFCIARPCRLHRHQMDMKASWKSFHRLRVFHWFQDMAPTQKSECE